MINKREQLRVKIEDFKKRDISIIQELMPKHAKLNKINAVKETKEYLEIRGQIIDMLSEIRSNAVQTMECENHIALLDEEEQRKDSLE